jgi:50S ribosomal protein L16 3-hydroxylase
MSSSSGFDLEAFVERYWEREPRLARGAVPGFASPIAPEELAALACRDDVESRIVIERDGDERWELRHGPFDDDDFAALPEERWTLLVHEVDRRVPEIAALLERFRFVPNWRIDDVMVSYAAPGGSVGAHVDRYDVFLLQGSGRRRWRIGRTPVVRPRYVDGADLPVLAEFEYDEEWVLEPGDMLYLPPDMPHEGVALEPCMTLSIGFRAPGRKEIAAGFLGHVLESDVEDPRYPGGAATVPRDDPGRIDPELLDWVGATLRGLASDPERVARWFGRFVTESRRVAPDPDPDAAVDPDRLAEALQAGSGLRRRAAAELAWLPARDGGAVLFAAGEAWDLEPDLAPLAPILCGTGTLDAARLAGHVREPSAARLLAELVQRGVLVLYSPRSGNPPEGRA